MPQLNRYGPLEVVRREVSGRETVKLVKIKISGRNIMKQDLDNVQVCQTTKVAEAQWNGTTQLITMHITESKTKQIIEKSCYGIEKNMIF